MTTDIPILPQVTANHTLRRVGHILANGRRAIRIFPAHTNLMSKFYQLYTSEQRVPNKTDEAPPTLKRKKGSAKEVPVVPTALDVFLATLQTYLSEAQGHIPQAMQADQIDSTLEEMKQLISEHGLLPILQYLLRMEASAASMF